jgi:prepilin-type N-terminal cleavage/methylation domain-containing protein
MISGRARGFTLLEVIIALAIMGAVVATAIAVQNSVITTGYRLSSGNQDWTAERFLRAQVESYDEELTKRLDVATFEYNEVSFVAHRSGQFGDAGPPVVVRYDFDPGAQQLDYEEVEVPPTWTGAGDLRAFRTAQRAGLTQPNTWRTTVYRALERGAFSFWDSGQELWVDQWTSSTPPPAVRLSLWTLAGRRDIILEVAGSSYFSSFGS